MLTMTKTNWSAQLVGMGWGWAGLGRALCGTSRSSSVKVHCIALYQPPWLDQCQRLWFITPSWTFTSTPLLLRVTSRRQMAKLPPWSVPGHSWSMSKPSCFESNWNIICWNMLNSTNLCYRGCHPLRYGDGCLRSDVCEPHQFREVPDATAWVGLHRHVGCNSDHLPHGRSDCILERCRSRLCSKHHLQRRNGWWLQVACSRNSLRILCFLIDMKR